MTAPRVPGDEHADPRTRPASDRDRAWPALLAIHAATTADACARALLAGLREQGIAGAALCWSLRWPQAIVQLPADAGRHASAASAVAAYRGGLAGTDGDRVLCDDGESAAVLCAAALAPGLLDEAGTRPLLQAAGMRLSELLQLERLRATNQQLAHAEQLQNALFAIADMAGSNLDMPQMLQGLHAIARGLMYAENFYIVMHERERDVLRFLYFADTVDPHGVSPDAEVPMADLERGITWYLIRDGKPLMGPTASLRQQVSGPLRDLSAESADWLGVPMIRDGQVCGAVVVQSYLPGSQYSAEDRALLGFVAGHILTALERKRGQAELEQRVAERTRQLAQANAGLQQQVFERLRAEHLQATLYRIAALANTDEDAESFYRQIHGAVGELINTENFYIALLSDDGRSLDFPYSVDAGDGPKRSRPLGRGLSEYVMRQGTGLLSDLAMDQQLAEAGEIDPIPTTAAPSLLWLGVPLLDRNQVIGVIAVQSYTADVTYDARDMELLTFVSHQIASSLQRRRGAEKLRLLNAELEHRVLTRTRELQDQIAVREQVEAQLKHQVMHDPLTALPNRLYLRDRLERAIAGLRRSPDRPFALLYLDIDHFKLFNDSLGHLVGDEILREVARRMAECIRAPDLVARLSGDEFAILLEYAPEPHAACVVAERVQDALNKPMRVGGRELRTSASIGIAIGDLRYRGTDALLHDADVALYRAKSAGRQRYVLFDGSLQEPANVAGDGQPAGG